MSFIKFSKKEAILAIIIGSIVVPLVVIWGKQMDAERAANDAEIEKIMEMPNETGNEATEVKLKIAAFTENNCIGESKCVSFKDGKMSFSSKDSNLLSEQLERLNSQFMLANEVHSKEIARLEAVKKQEEALAKQKAISDGSYMPSRSDIRPTCKRMVESNSLTGYVNWGWFNSSWFPQQKTLILRGKSKNAFGVEIPFSAECRWEKGGNIRLVEITR